MRWYWLIVVLASCYSIAQSDASKRKSYETRAASPHGPAIERVVALAFLALATWQSLVLWSPR
jgi:hypothetical protein